MWYEASLYVKADYTGLEGQKAYLLSQRDVSIGRVTAEQDAPHSRLSLGFFRSILIENRSSRNN